MQNYLWRYSFNYHRLGNIDGLFIATEEQVNSLIGRTINYGDVLGKHSDISYTFSEGDIIRVVVSTNTVEELRTALGTNTISGYNPLDYLEDIQFAKCSQCGFIEEYDKWQWFYDENTDGNIDICSNCGHKQKVTPYYLNEQ